MMRTSPPVSMIAFPATCFGSSALVLEPFVNKNDSISLARHEDVPKHDDLAVTRPFHFCLEPDLALHYLDCTSGANGRGG